MSEDHTAAWYTANPLADIYAREQPGRFAGKSAAAAPPKMFMGGASDTPMFTASGIDPQALLRLPFGIRHAAAEEPDVNKVFAMFEHYIGIPDAKIESAGLTEAQSRIKRWFEETPDLRPPEMIAAEDRTELEQYQRSSAPDGLLPAEREQQRVDAWTAKQAAQQREDDARWARVAAKEQQRFADAVAASEGRGWR